VKARRDWFLARRNETGTSPFGITIQLLGVGTLLAGLYFIYPPMAYLVGGLGAIVVGEKL
jgi:hypothetical protein